MVQRLEAELDQASAVRGLIIIVATRSPKPLTFGDAVGELLVESNVLRAQLGSLTKPRSDSSESRPGPCRFATRMPARPPTPWSQTSRTGGSMPPAAQHHYSLNA
jgi:hypothetical protein